MDSFHNKICIDLCQSLNKSCTDSRLIPKEYIETGTWADLNRDFIYIVIFHTQDFGQTSRILEYELDILNLGLNDIQWSLPGFVARVRDGNADLG